MRRTRRQQENENQVIQAIKWWQRSVLKALVFVLLPLALLYVAFAWWVGTPAGRDFTGWTEFENRSEKRLESLEQEQQKTLDDFTESTNQDVQNTINDIHEATEDTTGTEYYEEDPYTAPETQEPVEQPSQETNEANETVSERPKKIIEWDESTNDTNSQAVSPQGPEGDHTHYDEDGNVIENYEE